MNESKGMAGVAMGAESGLSNAASVDFDCGGEGTHMATEEGLSHLWDNVGCSDDHTRDCNQLVNIWKTKIVLHMEGEK